MLDSMRQQLEEMKESFPSVQWEEKPDGNILVHIPGIPLPTGWTKKQITLTLCLPPGFPQSKPNGFETDEDLRLANGSIPGGGSPLQRHEKNFLHFCWQPKRWDGCRETIWRYAKFCIQRLSEAK